MRLLVLALALLPAAALAGEREEGASPSRTAPPSLSKLPLRAGLLAKRLDQCQNASARQVAPADKPLRTRPLNREPLAEGYLTVLRLEDGCDKPVKVGERIRH